MLDNLDVPLITFNFLGNELYSVHSLNIPSQGDIIFLTVGSQDHLVKHKFKVRSVFRSYESTNYFGTMMRREDVFINLERLHSIHDIPNLDSEPTGYTVLLSGSGKEVSSGIPNDDFPDA